jgi:hypothetical protein
VALLCRPEGELEQVEGRAAPQRRVHDLLAAAAAARALQHQLLGLRLQRAGNLRPAGLRGGLGRRRCALLLLLVWGRVGDLLQPRAARLKRGQLALLATAALRGRLLRVAALLLSLGLVVGGLLPASRDERRKRRVTALACPTLRRQTRLAGELLAGA